jgi:DNA-binding transcriptional MerR regulator
MLIGELGRRAKVSTRAIRYYDSEGLLSARRGANGYREFDELDVVAVEHIRKLLQAGLTTKTIREILPCIVRFDPESVVCERTRSILKREYERIRGQITELEQSQKLLKDALGIEDSQ